MPFEKAINIKPDPTDVILRTGKTATFRFPSTGADLSARHLLHITCEDRMFFGWKTESPGDKLFMLIDDSLDVQHADNCQYCLDLSCSDEKPYPKRALHKVVWPEQISTFHRFGETTRWRFGIRVWANGLHIGENGYLRVRLERWDMQEGISPRQTSEEPAETFLLDVPEGSYSYRTLQMSVDIPDNTACLLFTVEAERYSGDVYLEEPFLTGESGQNYLPGFAPIVPGVEEFAWLGQNLSRKEWPELRIMLNDRIIHDGELFLRKHRYASVDLDIPEGCLFPGENKLSITYLSHYHDPVPLAFREIRLLQQPRNAVSIVSCPEIAVQGENAPVLVETQEDDLTLTLESDDLEAVSSLSLPNRGLHVILLRPKCLKNHLRFAVRFGNERCEAEIAQLVQRKGDKILCGSGDMIYVNHDAVKDVADYLKWYLENHLGNMITVRPRYRWCGSRFLNPDAWKLFREICTGMHICYPQITDGADPPALQNNPSSEMLKGPCYLGKQEHERDGQLFYWHYPFAEVEPVAEEFFDLAQKLYRESPETAEETYNPQNIAVQKGEMSLKRDVNCAADLRLAHDCALASLRRIRNGYLRHTGPTVMFKYFYEAGFSWLGAETMYSSTEPLVAFLRGAAKANEKKRTGVHLALQWSTFPHNTEQRYRRYLLALLVPYLQGVTDFNTEEGWLHLENGFVSFDRFSDACRKHREQEQRFFRYVSTHSRSGRYDTDVAFLHGRCDGWNGFYYKVLWGMPHMPIGEAEQSWRLMKLFYPLSCFAERSLQTPFDAPDSCSAPMGYYSGTPNGNADVVPIENGSFSDYRLLCFTGYNAAQKEDFDRIFRFVQNGGTLVAAWPHFAVTTELSAIQNRQFSFLRHPLTEILTSGEPEFSTGHVNGEAFCVCINLSDTSDVLKTTDEGLPLLCSVQCGEGHIVLLNCCAYPGNQTLYPIYSEAILNLRAELAAQRDSEILCGEDVEYTAYRQSDGSLHYYVLAVDWYRDPIPMRQIRLRLGDQLYPIEIPFGMPVRIVVSDRCAAWSTNESVEVIEANRCSVVAQGLGYAEIHLLSGKKEFVLQVDFDRQPLQTVRLHPDILST